MIFRQLPHTAPAIDALPGVATAIEGLDVATLRQAIQDEYALVANEPERGFHFHTGRRLAAILEYDAEWLRGIPESTIASFAGTGNPFVAGKPASGENVVDVGCGAGIDSMIAAKFVAPSGRVVGVDMTPAMVEKAQRNAAESGISNVDFRQGMAESLPVPNGWADVVISNGVLNLFPDKLAGLQEMARVLKPGGRMQIGDILVQKAVGPKGKRDIDLWKG
ncbi:MAG TPA: methyltransferase domain-containing protein [Thermoanaerobaculia bacterium]|nr:methyltransferase domain-containing protein [Thermoanaerobaculia bacterium]